MINISGHFRNERTQLGFCNMDIPLMVNCCGKQIFQTQDYFCNREKGRLDYQIIYVFRGEGHYFIDHHWITLAAGNIVLYRPTVPQFYSYFAKEKPEIAEVIEVGPGTQNIEGKEVRMYIKKGDRVIVSKYAGTEVKCDGEEYNIVRQNDILAIVE